MRILILGGRNEANFIIRTFNTRANELVIVNGDKKTAQYISEANNVDVVRSDPTKLYTYENISIKNFDLVISLLENDSDNYIACTIAKKLYGVKKAICTVTNPDNVAIFEALGIDSPISGTYLLSQRIEEESDVESLFKTMSLENEKVRIIEFRVRKKFDCVGKSLKDLNIPDYGNVCAIFRNPDMIIPKGNTIIKAGDRLILACAPADQANLIAFMSTEKVINEKEE